MTNNITQYEVKVYLKHKRRCFAKATVSNDSDLQDLYDGLRSESTVFNFGDIWIMKDEIKYVTIKEK